MTAIAAGAMRQRVRRRSAAAGRATIWEGETTSVPTEESAS